MSKQNITNTFQGGLDWDSHLTVGDNTNYRYALNIISNDEDQLTFKSNEHSNRLLYEFPGSIIGKKYITQLASSLFLIEGGKIYLFNHTTEECKFVAESSEFGCDWGMNGCEWINIHNYYQYINDLWITYSSNKVYYNINITELLDEKRKDGLKKSLSSGCGTGCSQRTCEYFKVFKKVCNPHLEAIVNNGGTLRNGTYFIGGRYTNSQGGYSNPFVMTPAIHIGGKNNIPGEISNKRIDISIRNASCVFDQIELFVHELIDGQTITKVLPIQYIVGDTFDITYTGSENSIPIDISELLINSRTYIEGEDLLIYNNRAIYYRTTPEFEYNFQSIANQIQVNWYAVKVPLTDMKKYNIKSFNRGETYAFSFSPNYTSGKIGYGFHIPAINGGGNCASFPYNEPEEEVHITGGKSKKINGNCGSDNPAAVIDGKIKLLFGGCNGTEIATYKLDTDNFCDATLLYDDVEEYKLSKPGVYKLTDTQESFVREWDGSKFINGCIICLNSSQGGGGGSCSNKPSITSSMGESVQSSIDIKTGLLYDRIRTAVPSTVNNPSNEKFLDAAKDIIETWEATNEDILNAIGPAIVPDESCINCGGENGVNLQTSSTDCEDCASNGAIIGDINIKVPFPKDELNQYANVKDSQKNKDISSKDSPKVEEIGALWFNALSNYLHEEKESANGSHTKSDNNVVGSSPAELLKNPVKAISFLKQAAVDITNAVKNRERFEFSYEPHKINKTSDYTSSSLAEFENNSNKPFKSTDFTVSYNEDGSFNTLGTKDIEVLPNMFNKYPIIARGRTIPKKESTTYPCIVDCYGNEIYCGLGGKNVTHHTFPSNVDIPFWEPKSSGGGSTHETDSNIMDGYAIVLGVEFTNINIPNAIKGFLCASNPYTFGVVKRTSSNSSVILKGLGTELFKGTNQGKNYLYFKYGMNSREKISKYIDSDGAGKRIGGTSDDTNNINIYSLDQLLRTPYLNGTHLKREGTMFATGSRHSLYNKGIEQKDNRFRRKDIGGSIHTMTVHKFIPTNEKFEIEGQIYADPNTVVAPDSGNTPFMNKNGQSCAWITANGVGRGINDNSFVGDVLQDKAPITNAEGDYFSIIRELDSQYGDISLLNYSSILQARGFDQSVRGLVGDTYIGVYGFVKTGYVSDKVGNYFPIGNMVPGKVDRCICDDPEDAVNSLIGNWYWKKLPIDGDKADPKRWAGTHTDSITRTWSEAQGRDTESHYYYPAATKHYIEYVGEFEANPWLRQKSDLLHEQVGTDLNPLFTLHPDDNLGGDWEDSYLGNFHKLIEQASAAQLALKVLILSFINLALPVLGITDLLDAKNGIDFSSNMLEAVIQVAVWLLAAQVLFTNDFVDKFLRLDSCSRDEEGGEKQFIEKWFENYSAYNNDYSIDYFYPTIKGLPLSYTGCIANNSVTSTYYISDSNDISYYVNGYQIVRPNSKVNLEETYGKITKMYVLGGSLFIHTTSGIYKSQPGQVTSPTNVGELLIGTNSMLSYPQLITNSSDAGVYGLQHPNHGFLTDMGFIFVDYDAKSLVIFSGSEYLLLSSPKYKMSSFFKQYLEFCNDNSDCKFEQKEDTPHFAMGIDNKYKRILFTKSDSQNSYTLSFDLLNQRWCSFHSYIPQEYHNDRNNLYSIYNNSIYNHDVTDKFTTYYDEFKGMFIDFTTTADQEHFDYIHTKIFTEATESNKRNLDVTFNTVALLNSWQTTGEIDLNVIKHGTETSSNTDKIDDKLTSIDLTKELSYFRFNEIFDYTQNHNNSTLITEYCNPEPKIVNSGNFYDRNSQTYDNRIVIDNFLYYRFIFNKFANIKLYIKKIDTAIDRKPS